MGGVFLDNNFSYAIFPLILISNEKYYALSSSEKILYVLLLNRTNYSQKNLKKFCDAKGVFIYYSNSQIQNHLKCSNKTAVEMLKNLEKAGLIKREHQKNGLPLKIYVTDLRTFNEKPRTNTYNNISFDIEKAIIKSQENRQNFGEKKNKKRSR